MTDSEGKRVSRKKQVQPKPHKTPRKRFTIGFLAGWEVYVGGLHSYLGALIAGVRTATQEQDCNVLFACGIVRQISPGYTCPAWPIPHLYHDFVPVGPWNTDALIVAAPLITDTQMRDIQQFAADGVPIVFAGDGAGRPAAIFDNEIGVKQAMAHLVEHGHKSVAFIAGHANEQDGDSLFRHAAYQAAVREYGLTDDPRLVSYGQQNTIGGYRAMQQILSLGADFTAVLASNDESAIGAMRALDEAGLQVPQDIAVIGFDDRPEAAAHVPPLTTVHASPFELGYRATRLLLERLAGREGPGTVRVPTRLIVRRSCGCPTGATVGLSASLTRQITHADPAAVKRQLAQAMTEAVLAEAQYMVSDEVHELCLRLVAAFTSSLEEGSAAVFQTTIEDVLQRVEAKAEYPHTWQAALTILGDATPLLVTEQAPLAEEMLRYARLITTERAQWFSQHRAFNQAAVVAQAGILPVRLHRAQNESEVLNELAAYLPDVGIRHAAVAFYEPEGDDPAAWSSIRRLPGETTQRFSTRQFPPPGSYDEPFSLALLPLVFQDEAEGFVAFDTAHLDPCAVTVRQLAAEYERRQAEAALREGEQRYRLITDNMTDTVWLMDMGLKTTFISPSVERSRGFNLEELAQLPLEKNLTPDSLTVVVRVLGEELTPERLAQKDLHIARTMDLEFYCKDGSTVWNEDTISLLRDEQGQPIGFLGVGRDITQRRQVEEEVHRTHQELEQRTANLEHQTSHLQIAAEISREIGAEHSLRDLLDNTVSLIQSRFDLYYVGIFLLDEMGEYALLKAAAGGAGPQMVQDGFKLHSGETSIVGQAARTGQSCVAFDVGEDAVRFDYPLLPETRSQAALPIRSGDWAIGILDVQSERERAFDTGDVAVLQTITDQLAVAIANARLIERTQDQLRELSRLYGEYSASAWSESLPQEGATSYVYDLVELTSAANVNDATFNAAVAQGKTVALSGPEAEGAVLATPLRLRNQVIGVLGIQETGVGRQWSPSEIALIEAVSEQVAQALENARLFAETQKAAQRMEALYDTSRALSSTLDEEALMHSVLEAVYRALDCEYVIVSAVDESARTIGAKHGIWHGQLDAFPDWIGMSHYSLDHPDILADIYRTGRTEIIGEWDDRLNHEIWTKFHHERLLRIMMPIKMREKVIAIVEVGYEKAKKTEITKEELQMLAAFMDQAAVVLENARLFGQARQRAQQEHQIYEITSKLRRSPNIAGILQTAVEELGRALQADRVLVRMIKPGEEQKQ